MGSTYWTDMASLWAALPSTLRSWWLLSDQPRPQLTSATCWRDRSSVWGSRVGLCWAHWTGSPVPDPFQLHTDPGNIWRFPRHRRLEARALWRTAPRTVAHGWRPRPISSAAVSLQIGSASGSPCWWFQPMEGRATLIGGQDEWVWLLTVLVEVPDVVVFGPQPVVELRCKNLLHVAFLAGNDLLAFHGYLWWLFIKLSQSHKSYGLNNATISESIRVCLLTQDSSDGLNLDSLL